jgi:hypothetical protein
MTTIKDEPAAAVIFHLRPRKPNSDYQNVKMTDIIHRMFQ